MPKVKVKSVPVRYNGKAYKRGESFEMAEKYFDDAIVEKVKEAPPKSPPKVPPENAKDEGKEKK